MLRQTLPSLLARAALALALVGGSAHAEATDLARMVPGGFQVGLFSNLSMLMADFPGIAHEGWVGEAFDGLVAEGYPDFREGANQFALGLELDLVKQVPKEVLLLGTGDLDVVPRVRRLADEKGIRLREVPYRGVTFLQPLSRLMPLWAAELPGGVSHLHFDRRLSLWPGRRFRKSKQLVDLLRGQGMSFGDRHGLSLDADTYLVGGMKIDVGEAQAAAADADPDRAFGFHGMAHATGAWRKQGGRVRLGAELGARSDKWARKLEGYLTGKLDEWKQATSQPLVKALLEAVEIRCLSASVFVALDFDLAGARARLDG